MSARDIEDRAAEWVARHDGEGWNAQAQAEFDAWLGEATAHRVAYLRLDAAWQASARLSALNGPASPSAPARHRWPVWSRAAAAVIVAIGAAGAMLMLRNAPAEAPVYVTEIGEHATVPLADGSKVELNTDSEMRADVTPTKRTVWLERGEAYFEVAHDRRHPFVVLAGDRRITVLGTKFSVRRDGEGVDVVVAEGRVRVEAPGQPTPPTIVTRGDVLIAKADESLVAQKTPQDVDNALGWRQGLIIFGQSDLANLAEEFNRYNRKKIVILDAAAGRVRLGGTFEATNLDAFIRLLERGFSLKVVDKGDEIEISS